MIHTFTLYLNMSCVLIMQFKKKNKLLAYLYCALKKRLKPFLNYVIVLIYFIIISVFFRKNNQCIISQEEHVIHVNFVLNIFKRIISKVV